MIPQPDPDASRLARALRSLPRASAPAELEAQLRAELGAEAAPSARALESLPRASAPRELEERLRAELETAAAEEPGWEEPIGTLPRLRAPEVLARLVAEELTNPAATVERFVGDLPRHTVAADHQGDSTRFERTLEPQGPSQNWLRRPTLRAGLALAAAAAVVVWIGGAEWLQPDRSARTFSTPFVWAESSASLDPAAAWIAGSFSGPADLVSAASPDQESR